MDHKKKAETLLRQLEAKRGLNRRKVEKRLKYSENYIDQVLSKGANAKFVAKLEELLNNPDVIDYDMGIAIRRIQASNEVILSAIGELLAKGSGMTVTSVQEQLETLVEKRLTSSES